MGGTWRFLLQSHAEESGGNLFQLFLGNIKI